MTSQCADDIRNVVFDVLEVAVSNAAARVQDAVLVKTATGFLLTVDNRVFRIVIDQQEAMLPDDLPHCVDYQALNGETYQSETEFWRKL